MFADFLKEGGVAIADRLNINRARALERFDKNYDIADIERLKSITGQANETWLRKTGLLYSVGGRYELSPIAKAIIGKKISLAEYCFLILSKQWIKIKEVGEKDEYKDNLLSFILSDLLEYKSIPVDDFVAHVGQIVLEKYKNNYRELEPSNQEAARFLIDPLLISGLIIESNGNYLISPSIVELATDYVSKANGIKRIDQVSCADEEYWNSFQYGIYDIINEENKSLYIKHYPHLFIMKEQSTEKKDTPLQQIFYGAPGTGKSHEVKKRTGELSNDGEDRDLPNVFRTTFHPDTDYASFVGCYKPSMRKTGKKHQVDGKDVDDEEIIYEFVSQAFTDAYVYAYTNPTEPTYLVIEEINRGNCAQIFGDLFQLLDRKKGVSEYKIKADKDLAKFLNKELGKDADGIKDGKLCLPANLNIFATMNTSDQSLFPMDSAFKRRWDWKYIPIREGHEKRYIIAKGRKYDWWTFVDRMNSVVGDATSSEDKKMGFYFCKANDKKIDANTFVSKVVFYLWNDVFKDNGLDWTYDGNAVFKYKDENDKEVEMTFASFFNADGTANEVQVGRLMKNLKIEGTLLDEELEEVDENLRDNMDLTVVYKGETIHESSASDTFVKTLQAIGLEKFVDKKIANAIMVKSEEEESRTWRKVDDYYVYVGWWANYKKKWLQQMAKELELDLRVD